MSDGLEVWTPVRHEVTLGGRQIVVAPLKAADFAAVQALARPVVARMTELRFQELTEDGYPDVAALVARAAHVPVEWLDGQDTSDVLTLLGLVLEVNLDFSRRRIAPALVGLAATLNKLLDGGSSSPASASSGTTATPSSV